MNKCFGPHAAVIYQVPYYHADFVRAFNNMTVPLGYDKYLMYDKDKADAMEFLPHLEAAAGCVGWSLDEMEREGYMLYDPDGKGPTYVGNNQLPVLNLIRTLGQTYSFYWFIEYDTVFTGTWAKLFNFYDRFKHDFIATNYSPVRMTWKLWSALVDPNNQPPTGRPPHKEMRSLNCCYRISANAGLHLDQKCREGWKGHHEVLMASLLHWSRASTMRLNNMVGKVTSSPVMRRNDLAQADKLYHPVKPDWWTPPKQRKIVLQPMYNPNHRLKPYRKRRAGVTGRRAK